MEYTINSKKLGKKITFSSQNSGYIFVDTNGKPGLLGDQICQGGKFTGPTLFHIGEDEELFKKICKRWYKKHVSNLNDFRM